MICKSGKIFSHKYWELQLDRTHFDTIFDIELKYTIKGDHCGFTFRIEFLTLYFHFITYDNRHWNYVKGKFV